MCVLVYTTGVGLPFQHCVYTIVATVISTIDHR